MEYKINAESGKTSFISKIKNLVNSIMLKFIPTQTKRAELEKKFSLLRKINVTHANGEINKILPNDKIAFLSEAISFKLLRDGVTMKELNKMYLELPTYKEKNRQENADFKIETEVNEFFNSIALDCLTYSTSQNKLNPSQDYSSVSLNFYTTVSQLMNPKDEDHYLTEFFQGVEESSVDQG